LRPTVRAVDKSGADNATCSVATPCETIGQAVSVAGADDVIDIGPGSYDEAVVADQRLHFRGAGPGSYDSLITAGTTRIQPLVDDGAALELRAGGSAHDLQLVGKANASPGNRPGLLLTAPAAGGALAFDIQRVNAFRGETGAGTRKEGIRIDDAGTARQLDASFRALTLAPGATDDGSDGLIADGPNVTATLDRVTIRPLSDQVRFPLWARNGSALVLRQSTMLPTGTVNIGVFLQDTGAEAEIERSDLRANGSVLRVSNTGGGVAHAFAHDSVLAGVSSAPGDPTTVPTVTAASFSAGDATVSLLGTTVASRRAQPEGINLVSSSVGGATVNVRNTLVRATSTAGQAAPDVHVQPGNGPAAFAAANSSYDEAVVDAPVGGGTGTATAPGTEGNLAGDPGLVDEAGGNLRLNTSSPVVDRGDAGLVAPNELDLDDDPRTVDGDGDGDGVATPDTGAYELLQRLSIRFLQIAADPQRAVANPRDPSFGEISPTTARAGVLGSYVSDEDLDLAQPFLGFDGVLTGPFDPFPDDDDEDPVRRRLRNGNGNGLHGDGHGDDARARAEQGLRAAGRRGVVTQFPLPNVPFVELIWAYWMDECGLAQTMNLILARFQNRRVGGGRDVLSRFNANPLLPIANLLWGFAEAEDGRLTVRRRAAEYRNMYGLPMQGKAVPPASAWIDDRSQFLSAFHNLLNATYRFYKERDDKTVDADAFPLLSSLQELHLVLAYGAHNQFPALALRTRREFLVMQWILAQPELREFLGGPTMVPQEEQWMDRVDTMKELQGWSPTSVTHFLDLALCGEQILLTVRHGRWNESTRTRDDAANWAITWRNEIQRYVHAYRAVTGVDLQTGVDATPPSVLLARRERGPARG